MNCCEKCKSFTPDAPNRRDVFYCIKRKQYLPKTSIDFLGCHEFELLSVKTMVTIEAFAWVNKEGKIINVYVSKNIAEDCNQLAEDGQVITLIGTAEVEIEHKCDLKCSRIWEPHLAGARRCNVCGRVYNPNNEGEKWRFE